MMTMLACLLTAEDAVCEQTLKLLAQSVHTTL